MVTEQIDAALFARYLKLASDSMVSGWLSGIGVRSTDAMVEKIRTHEGVAESLTDYPGLGKATAEKIQAHDRDEFELAVMALEEAAAEEEAEYRKRLAAETKAKKATIRADLQEVLDRLRACDNPSDFGALADGVPNVIGRMTHDPTLMAEVEAEMGFWEAIQVDRDSAAAFLAEEERKANIRRQREAEARAAEAREAEIDARRREFKDTTETFEVKLLEDPAYSEIIPKVRQLLPMRAQEVVGQMIKDGVLNEEDFTWMLSRVSNCRHAARWTRGFDAIVAEVYKFEENAVMTARKRFAEKVERTPLYAGLPISRDLLKGLPKAAPKKRRDPKPKKKPEAKKPRQPQHVRPGMALRVLAGKYPVLQSLVS